MSELQLWDGNHSGTQVVNLITGETLDLTSASFTKLARARADLMDTRYAIDRVSRLLQSELAARLDHENRRSINLNGLHVVVNAPQETVWDVDRLRENLDKLVNEGRIGKGVVPRALKTEVSYKPVANELKKLLAHDDPMVRDLVSECQRTQEAQRKVTVTATTKGDT